MIVHGSTPPYRALPQSLRQRSSQPLPIARSQNCEVSTGAAFKNTTEQKRPKSSPLKISKKPSDEFRGDRQSHKDSIKAVEGAFNDKGTMYFKVVQPGYAIAKRRSGINVTLNMDELWAGASKDCKKSLPVQDEKDLKIKKLQQEVDDVKAMLAEERISNTSYFQEFVENTKIDVEVMIQQHRDHIKTIEEERELELENLKAVYEAKINQEKEDANLREIELQDEIDSIKETLQTCQEDFSSELEKQWLERKKDSDADQRRETEQLLKDQKKKLRSEQIAALNEVTERHVRELDSVKEAHHKELNAVHAEFAAFAADAENFKIIAMEAEKLKEDLKDLQDVHEKTKEILRKTKNELADTKVQLQGYELSFSEKVADVEERYSMKIQGLMLNNSDMRRNYMKKCADLLDNQNNDSLKVESRKETDESTQRPGKQKQKKTRKTSSTRNAMKTIILARAKADISLVTNKPKMEHGGSKRAQPPSRRPRSAPVFKPEVSQEDNMFLTISELRTYRPNSSLA